METTNVSFGGLIFTDTRYSVEVEAVSKDNGTKYNNTKKCNNNNKAQI